MSISQSTYTIAGTEYSYASAYAYFYEIPNGAQNPCERRQLAACDVNLCKLGTVNTDGGTPARPHAGPIGIKTSGNTATLQPKADGTYGAFVSNSAFWRIGEPLLISAAGKQVPSLNETLKAPSIAQVGTPVLPAAGELAVHRNQDLALSWTGASEGELVVTITQADSTFSTQATCTFSASAKTGNIPKDVWALMKPGVGYMGVNTQNSTRQTLSGWQIDFTANSQAVSSSGALYQPRLNLE